MEVIARERMRYGRATRERALILANEVGPAEAAKRLGINEGTLRSWVTRQRQVGSLVTPVAADVLDRLPIAWEGRQGDVANDYGRLSDAFREAAGQMIREGRLRDARDAIVGSAVATDKAQLLSGHATTRSESRSVTMRATVDEVNDLLARLPRRQGLVIPSRTTPDQGECAQGTEIAADGAADG